MSEGRSDRVLMHLFDGSNFAAWKLRMKVLLEERELTECVQNNAADLEELQDEEDDSRAEKNRKAKAREKREGKDRRCKSLLISRIHDSQLEYVQEKETPKDVWDALHRVFQRRSIATRMHLKREMVHFKYESGTLQQHFLRYDKLVREYRAAGANLDELDVICNLLVSLGSAYDGVVTAIETVPEEALSIEFVKCRLLDEETKRRVMGPTPSTSSSDTAFFGGGDKKKQKQKKPLKCFGCGKEDHKVANCPDKDEEKQQEIPKARKSKANVADSTEKEICMIGVCGEMEVSESSCSKWCIDSGATDHLVRDKELFSELHRLEKPVKIAVAKDGASIVAEQAGTIRVVSVVGDELIKCVMKEALYVPGLREMTEDELLSDEECEDAEEVPEPEQEADVQEAHDVPVGRSQRIRTAPVWHRDFDMEYTAFALGAMNFVEDIPSSIGELKQRDDLVECKPISMPIENRLRQKKGEEHERSPKPYRESLSTRSDMSAAVNYFSQSCPTDERWNRKRMLRYINDWMIRVLQDLGQPRVYQRPSSGIFGPCLDWRRAVVEQGC